MRKLFRTLRFRLATGHWPIQDDLDRSYCKEAGKIGHCDCGWNRKHNKPNFMVPYAQR